MKKLILLAVVFIGTLSINAQTKEELQAEQAPKKAEIAKLQGEVDALQAKINTLPGWRKGAFGTIGGNLAGFNNWYSKGAPNSATGNIGFTVNAFANLIQEKFFWRNSVNVNLGWVKLDNKDITTDSSDFEHATDVFSISSLYGRNLNDKWAVSALGEYRTTLLDNFNDPGYLDIGVGFTWTPINNLVVVIHPANYNFVFSKGASAYDSSTGAKVIADYTASIKKVNLKSNFSLFQSYKGSELSNWTWINSLGYTLWKGIGVGFELGLRDNQQEALNLGVKNELQSYWLFGLNYSM